MLAMVLLIPTSIVLAGKHNYSPIVYITASSTQEIIAQYQSASTTLDVPGWPTEIWCEDVPKRFFLIHYSVTQCGWKTN